MVTMRTRPGGANPRLLLSLAAALAALVVQSGELGSADTMHRLQTAHSFWTSEPAVFPNEYPEFGVHGRGGKLYDWYGIGQPLLLVPFDIAGTYLERLPVFRDYRGSDPTVRNIFVAASVNVLLSVLTALVGLRFLELLGFSVPHSIAGVLALLLCTTHLHYTQNMMENNYICLLTLTGFCFQYEWLRRGTTRALWFGSLALGMNLLTRLTTFLDLAGVAGFLVLVAWFEGRSSRAGNLVDGPRVERSSPSQINSPHLEHPGRTYANIALPVYAAILFLDRLYQFHRFGNWTTTYVHYFALEHRLNDPTLPANYPWETPFHVGFLGPLISREKSIFLFDPLLVLTILLVAFGWRRFSPSVKAYLAAALALVLAYICLYARYTVWSGDFAWGDRYVSTAVQLAAFISVPILLAHRAHFKRIIWPVGIGLVAVSLVVQLASLAFWLPLEIYQGDDFGHPQFVIWLRFKNIAAFALGKMDAWSLNTDAMTYDAWDYQHITTWNFLPFVLRRIGAAPAWVVRVALGLWLAAVAGLLYTLVALGRNLAAVSATAQKPATPA
ncbi:MAG: hypothetical protein J2P13_02190 [Acidobacteria bacterium]|nr:hypothetical protein [Acidobacteriota bacterium]